MEDKNISHRNDDATNTRTEALEFIYALHARTLDIVIGFRERHLGRGLLPPDRVHSWVKSRAKTEGKPSFWAVAAVPSEQVERVGLELRLKKAIPTRSGATLERRVLRVAVMSGPPITEFTRAGGALEDLRYCAERLCERFPWREDEAAAFVLMDRPPSAPVIVANAVERSPLTAASRIALTIDPMATPEEVADFYRTLRARWSDSKQRTQSDKHVSLAKFLHQAPDDRDWDELFARWNRENDEWSYKLKHNFKRDALQALERLLYPKIEIEKVKDS